MSKIKITKEIKELDGVVIEKPVTPFGTSAHIPFSKKHTGKIVSVVVPSEARYVWVLSKEELNIACKESEKLLKEMPEGRYTFLLAECIKNIKEKEFSLDDLNKVLSILKKNKKNNVFVKKIESIYQL